MRKRTLIAPIASAAAAAAIATALGGLGAASAAGPACTPVHPAPRPAMSDKGWPVVPGS